LRDVVWSIRVLPITWTAAARRPFHQENDMAYDDPQDRAFREQRERKEGAEAVWRARVEAYQAKHGCSDGSSTLRAHLEQVVHTDMTTAPTRGSPPHQELEAAKERGWKELAEPAMQEWEKRYGERMPDAVFKAVFAGRPSSSKLTGVELEQRYRVLCEDLGAANVAAVDAQMRGMPALKKAMEVMGTSQSGWANRKLVEAHKERVASGRSAASAARPWNKR
jgi:hypothetical protein